MIDTSDKKGDDPAGPYESDQCESGQPMRQYALFHEGLNLLRLHHKYARRNLHSCSGPDDCIPYPNPEE